MKRCKSNYNLTKLLKLWLNGFTNFSVRPLRASGVIGFIFTILGFIFIIGIVIQKQLVPETQIGWTSIMTCVIFFGGVQLLNNITNCRKMPFGGSCLIAARVR